MSDSFGEKLKNLLVENKLCENERFGSYHY